MVALVEVIFKDFKALISTVEVVATVASLAWDMASSQASSLAFRTIAQEITMVATLETALEIVKVASLEIVEKELTSQAQKGIGAATVAFVATATISSTLLLSSAIQLLWGSTLGTLSCEPSLGRLCRHLDHQYSQYMDLVIKHSLIIPSTYYQLALHLTLNFPYGNL